MKAVRCAIYTRKSSEEGLEQDFNSLHAQREACAAYVLSQASEGWVLLPGEYDDGGLSGGTLERPALQRLMADVAAGKVDIVVIYKLDRLTRSLLDFARLVEAFDQAGTSFVSITQSFNTTTSMGRLTLNMLLSFAQFEREVTAERIRDKIAASKAKGLWMGGIPPLGYEPDGRTLAIVEEHAALVRTIYARYQQLGTVRLVAQGLKAEGLTCPQRKTASGKPYGGRAFQRGQLYDILRNPVYTGRIAHRGELHQGQHPAIIPLDQWDAVQRQLAGKARGARRQEQPATSFLAGRLFDATGEPLIAAHARKGGKRYSYFVARTLHHDGREAARDGIRVPAGELEQVVVQELGLLLGNPLVLAERAAVVLAPRQVQPLMRRCKALASEVEARSAAAIAPLVRQVRVGKDQLTIRIAADHLMTALGLPAGSGDPQDFRLRCHARFTRTGRVVRLVQENGASAVPDGVDLTLVRLIAQARGWWSRIVNEGLEPSALAADERVSVSYIVRVLRLAFLSPAVVEAVLEGRLRAGIGSTALLDIRAIEPSWEHQERRCLPPP